MGFREAIDASALAYFKEGKDYLRVHKLVSKKWNLSEYEIHSNVVIAESQYKKWKEEQK